MWFKKSQRYKDIAYWFGQRFDGEACIQSTGILDAFGEFWQFLGYL